MAKTKKTKSNRALAAKPAISSHKIHKLNMMLIAAILLALVGCLIIATLLNTGSSQNNSSTTIEDWQAQPYNIVRPLVRPHAKPQALLAPSKIKTSYNLPSTGGSGVIAIVNAYDAPTVEADLNTFSSQYGLPSCTTANTCFEKHKMSSSVSVNQGWSIESSLDTQWAHAVAPTAKILLVEAKSSSGTDLINAVNYAKSRSGVVAVSMSWGGNEFSSEGLYESTFTSSTGILFVAASGDDGHGTSWPSVSANVLSVGGTRLNLNSGGAFSSEVAWSGSGGGVSTFIKEPSRQLSYNVPKASNRRVTPDVSYNADPDTGYPVYSSTPYGGYSGWFQVGGTSAGSPQWAAIAALSGKTLTLNKLYVDAAKVPQTTFRDIVSGTNGSCGWSCTTQTKFDFVTGLGSPLVSRF